MNDVLLLVSEAAKLLDVSPARVRQMEQQGHLVAERTGTGVRLFAPADVSVALGRDECGCQDRLRLAGRGLSAFTTIPCSRFSHSLTAISSRAVTGMPFFAFRSRMACMRQCRSGGPSLL
jgi:excisionase family DNA binding protein